MRANGTRNEVAKAVTSCTWPVIRCDLVVVYVLTEVVLLLSVYRVSNVILLRILLIQVIKQQLLSHDIELRDFFLLLGLEGLVRVGVRLPNALEFRLDRSCLPLLQLLLKYRFRLRLRDQAFNSGSQHLARHRHFMVFSFSNKLTRSSAGCKSAWGLNPTFGFRLLHREQTYWGSTSLMCSY